MKRFVCLSAMSISGLKTRLLVSQNESPTNYHLPNRPSLFKSPSSSGFLLLPCSRIHPTPLLSASNKLGSPLFYNFKLALVSLSSFYQHYCFSFLLLLLFPEEFSAFSVLIIDIFINEKSFYQCFFQHHWFLLFP